MRRLDFASASAALLVVLGLMSDGRAADMPLKAPATIASSWTGFYGGLGLGGRWAENDWRTSDVLAPFGFTQTAGDHGAMDSVAARISTFAGYNWQFAPAWIVGVEGDIGWANNNKTTTPLPGTIGNSLVPVAAVTNPPGGGFCFIEFLGRGYDEIADP
ncbi:MAG TPA: hypothetical protein VKX28_31840 [Xanthobacteraceae bacterium]|nr:hypothetical protein [Xanthobacteraceae bacterium]